MPPLPNKILCSSCGRVLALFPSLEELIQVEQDYRDRYEDSSQWTNERSFICSRCYMKGLDENDLTLN